MPKLFYKDIHERTSLIAEQSIYCDKAYTPVVANGILYQHVALMKLSHNIFNTLTSAVYAYRIIRTFVNA